MERHALRTCKDCGFSTTTFAGFVKNKGSKYGYRNLCISCAVKRNEANPKQKDWKTDHQTKKRYNVDVETYKRLMATSSCCQICESTQNLCYDHDHKTMEFRGVLCRSCNKAIGQLGDTVESLEKAVNYLKGIKQ
jgi:hypothetical protein